MRASGEISRKQEQAIAALLTCSSIADAVQQCGMAESTLYRWLKETAFRAAYREARRQVVQQAIGQLQQATGTAVQTLVTIMQYAEASASAKVSAAKAILETAVKAVEIEDLAARISALEQHLKEK
jgi:hypothetical protein